MTMPPAIFAHGEAELAEATGIHEKNLRRVRAQSLRQGDHWKLRDQHVVYSAVGAQLVIEKILGRDLKPEELAAALNASRLSEPVEKFPAVKAKVTKLYPNPWLIQVELPSGRCTNIRVKTSKNFRRGMEVPLRVLASGHFELARRMPRFPGRW